jgi:hypothetical protein
MLFLQSHHITDLFVLVADLLPKPRKNIRGGRPVILEASEVITILVWNTLVLQQKTLKSLHRFIQCYHTKDFPRFPTYNAFLMQVHRLLPLYLSLLERLMQSRSHLRFIDSTMLPVCAKRRMDAHRVARGIANLGKNWQGWHFGFKLHASIDPKGHLTGIFFSTASQHEHTALPFLVGRSPCLVVGDTSYASKRLREFFWNWRIFLLAPVNPRSGAKHPMGNWQKKLLDARSKIECVFDYLKEHLHLVTSFPRSVAGYFVHYVRILLGYQFFSLLRGE